MRSTRRSPPARSCSASDAPASQPVRTTPAASASELLPPILRLLFVGINPGRSSDALGSPFAPRSNRFWPALHAAGILDRRVDASAGLAPDDRDDLFARGIGITSLVHRATAAAVELEPAELVAGGRQLRRRVDELRPAVVAVLGVTAYRQAFADRRAVVGRQPGGIGPAELWVVPNPSGRNAHTTLAELAAAYRQVAEAAGITHGPAPRPGPTLQ